ncbi:hypothetical protein FOL46_000269 [Perkinsus olseni]|uniref:Uncharacterized protein n=1 Tax=Perkinsus olseni TaxID=32597 RepID=A0A7J6MIV3_PEROL|nr:hypothetical protein FOL46_000269 [Perkinsus olseni]
MMNYWRTALQLDGRAGNHRTSKKGGLDSIDASRPILCNLDEAGYWNAFSDYRAKRKEFFQRPSRNVSLSGSSPLVIAQRYPDAFNFPFSLKEYELEGAYMKHRMKLKAMRDGEKRRDRVKSATGSSREAYGNGMGLANRVPGSKALGRVGLSRAVSPPSKVMDEGLEIKLQKRGMRDFYLDPVGRFKTPSRSPPLYEQLKFRSSSDPRLASFILQIYEKLRSNADSVFSTVPEAAFRRYQGVFIRHLLGFAPDPPLAREPRFTDGLRFIVPDMAKLELGKEIDIFIAAVSETLETHVRKKMANIPDGEASDGNLRIKLGVSGLISLIKTAAGKKSLWQQQQQQNRETLADPSHCIDSTDQESPQAVLLSAVSESEQQASNKIEEALEAASRCEDDDDDDTLRDDAAGGNASQQSLSSSMRQRLEHARSIENDVSRVEADLREQLRVALEEQKRLKSLVDNLTCELERSTHEEVTISPKIEIICNFAPSSGDSDNASDVKSIESCTPHLNQQPGQNTFDCGSAGVCEDNREIAVAAVDALMVSIADTSASSQGPSFLEKWFFGYVRARIARLMLYMVHQSIRPDDAHINLG